MRDVERIEIFTRWVGFASPPSHAAKVVIVRAARGFSREQFPDGPSDELPVLFVQRFLAVLSLPMAPELDPRLFDVPEAVIRSHYGSAWTDDYPSHVVKVIFTDGGSTTVSTDSQHAFMLPLQVSDAANSEARLTFEPRLSQAIAGLMPDGYPEKERIAGHLGMLDWDLQQHLRGPDTPSDAQENHVTGDEIAQSPMTSNNSDSSYEQIIQILCREETPADKAEAERTGRLSERLLKRISLDDMRALLAQGANACIADSVGQTALMHAAWPPFDRDRFRLLVQGGADVEARRNDGYTGLHLACAGGEATAAEELVLAGTDVHARTLEQATPLMLAATWCEIVQLLLAAGADVNAVDNDGDCALTYAIVKQSWYQAERQIKAIQMLINAGSDLHRRNHQGLTLLGEARGVLSRVQLEAEVVQASPGKENSVDQDECRLAETVVNLLVSAGASN